MELSENKLREEAKSSSDGIIYKWAFALGADGALVTRHIPPQKIAIVYNQNYDKIAERYHNNQINWREYQKLKPMTLNVIKNDKILKKQITWYGGTNRDVSIHIYHTYEECIKEYNKKNYQVISKMKQLQEKIEKSIGELDKSFINTDYVMEHLSNSK